MPKLASLSLLQTNNRANTQRCDNVTLSLVRSDTTLLQCCHNIEDECYITMLPQCWYNIVAMLPQHWKIT